jgi:cytidylate kinase
VKRRAIITIDGPAGSGKSTLGRRLAQTLGYLYLDSGALYRAVAWQSGQADVDVADPQALEAFLGAFEPRVEAGARGFRVFVNGRELTSELRTPETSQASSLVAARPQVREWVNRQLRELAKDGGVVAEGRDLGEAVFPQAEVKFYLDARLDVRAARRRREWQTQGGAPALEGVKSELARRDRQDETRSASPLAIPAGATVIDTSDLDADQVLAACLYRIRAILDGDLQ